MSCWPWHFSSPPASLLNRPPGKGVSLSTAARQTSKKALMEQMLFNGWDSILRTACLGVLAYVTLVLMLRLSGKRTLSKMNAFDFVATVALGSTLASTLLSKDASLAQGAAAFGVLILLQFVVTWLSVRFKVGALNHRRRTADPHVQGRVSRNSAVSLASHEGRGARSHSRIGTQRIGLDQGGSARDGRLVHRHCECWHVGGQPVGRGGLRRCGRIWLTRLSHPKKQKSAHTRDASLSSVSSSPSGPG